MYHVRTGNTVVFRSKSLLQCEMVAISLTLSSMYGTMSTHEVMKKTTVETTVTPEIAFAMMQTKMRNLIYNRKITPKMISVPDNHLLKTKVISAVQKGQSLDGVKQRLCDEVDEFAAYASALMKEK